VAILAGVPVGRDSIIGAHAVVNKNVPEFAIAAGVRRSFCRTADKGKEHNEILKGESVGQPVK